MRRRVLMVSCVLVCFGILIGGSLDTHAQFQGLVPATLPDLVVSNIACKAPSSKLAFTVANNGIALPTGWKAVADVYVGTTKLGSIDLRYPSSGSIAPRLGSAQYVTKTIITKSSSVKVVVDPLKTVKESNESNNSKTQTLAPCTSTATSTTEPQVTLDYQIK